MKWSQFNRSDWGLIRPQLIWFGAAMLGAGVCILAAQAYVYFTESELSAQRARVREMSQSAEMAQQNWQAVQQYQRQYLQLQQAGLIGQEHRLDWFEALSQLKQEQPVWQLEYTFSPQRPKEGVDAQLQLTVFASEMRVHWRAGTEWDLSAFHTWLNQQKGRAVAKDCQFSRIDNPPPAAIDVECRYDWLSIAPHKEAKP